MRIIEVKTDDMQTLKSYYFSDQLHLALYGESFQDRLKRELIAQKTKATEKLLRETDLTTDQIAKIQELSKETVIAIQSRMDKE